MKVVLLQDVERVGKKYQVKHVADGYARNYLIPNNLAKPATEEVLAWLEAQREILERKAEAELKKAQETASGLENAEVSIPVKVGEEGQLFESVGAQKIADALKGMGFDVKKSQIRLADPIKETGETSVKIVLEHNLEAEVRVVVLPKEE